LAAALVALLPTASASANESVGYDRGDSSVVVIANRGSGDISLIDTDTHEVTTLDLPGEAQPMYVNHDRRQGRVFIGDRSASQIVVLDDRTFELIDSVDVGDGVFHQWVDPSRRQLWVVGDTSQTVSVIDTRTLTVKATINIPADVAERGGRPHDVFVSGQHAYVTILGLADGSESEATVGEVIQYAAGSFDELRRVIVGDDPHVFVSGGSLYVASQNSSEVARFNARNLRPIKTTSVSSAHGIFVTSLGEVLITSIADGGIEAVSELDRALRRTVATVDTDVPIPHNLAVDDQRQLYITHSGPTANQVSIVSLDPDGFGEPITVTAGLNPFGLGFVR
jgi:YVTN family beta-propeller protein